MKVLILGAGELASGTALRLHRSGFDLLLTEIAAPLSVRRLVSFSEAVHGGEAAVEEARGRLVSNLAEAEAARWGGEVPVVVDPGHETGLAWRPDAIVDARILKGRHGLRRGVAPRVIGLGPGFTAGDDCDFAIETARGHDLGRVLSRGPTTPNTGVPGTIGGESARRVLRAPQAGRFTEVRHIGDAVREGEEVARVGDRPVRSSLHGVLRGLLRDGAEVAEGTKVGDVDPRTGVNIRTVSDKAMAVAGGVLEALLRGREDEVR